ncbi:succinate dehydrogenase flavoprotein subunit [Wickerhamomyces ciferrii]|uniref:Fumarate reductase n=1 Tax=Wickerhamomyces ciferrii (strain ATCC 14091 / BCRC 22168 / CBS 111 / JCM 3599 / NBRC 0793 / NRRL Y-1031 F-60-10) TaxID=1206466 RepID=K0KII7_WICCF|nr:succinate dehydrogenase flavoprotein subunit [Wickerhamomyces ciferrii]CCH45035.1 succinate dehydrogenase flavoprotein subunit [Wickerhamomyces ciferrii]
MRYIIPLLIIIISYYYYYQQQQQTMNKLPVIIIGTGLSGLSTSFKLLEQKIPVVLVDKLTKFGGNSIKASSGINGIQTNTQLQQGVQDSFEEFLNDTVKSSGFKGDLDLQKKLVSGSNRAINWLQKDIGVGLDLVNRLGGHSHERTHRSTGIPPGFEIISKLKSKILEYEDQGLELMMGWKLIDIKIEKGQIQGVFLQNEQREIKYIKTNHLIMATGGFSYSQELLSKYRPDLINFPTTNGEQTLGEGQILLEKIGAQLIDMDKIQIHPTGFINPSDPENRWKFLAAESLRGIGGVLLNIDQLERFIDELTTRDKVTEGILKQKDQKAYLVLNEDMYLDFKFQLDFYIKQGLVKKGTLKELFNEDSTKVHNVLINYSQNEIDPLGRSFKAHSFNNITVDTEIYLATITPVVHFTMGGVKINSEGQVLDTQGQLIQGLFAVGEISGGVHGENRLGGNSLLECVVFGLGVGEFIGGRY